MRLVVCVREPDVPVNVTFTFPVVASTAADKVMFCGVPGVRLKVDGLAVVPEGKPLSVTFTVPLNPIMGVAFTETACPEAPCVREIFEGVTDKLKSPGGGGGAVTDRANVAVCVNDLVAPVKVTVVFPIAALAAAVRVMFCGVPGVRLSVDGFAVTPTGRPLSITFTLPLNPFIGMAFTETIFPAPPCGMARLGGPKVKVNPAAGGAAVTDTAREAECVSDLETPVRVTVASPVEALGAAVKVMFCAVPGVRLRVEGCAVTPAGKPLSITLTVPLNPSTGIAFTETVFPVPPCGIAILAGERLRTKPNSVGAAVTDRESAAACGVSDPDVPITVTFALPIGASAVAVRVILCAVPGVRLRVEGLAVTPPGKPLSVT